MPSPEDLSNLPSDVTQRQLIRALKRLGFEISLSGGDGSHAKATWPTTQKSFPIRYKFTKQLLRVMIKQVREISGISWREIQEKL